MTIPYSEVDLAIRSDRDACKKWPSPFPEWSIATSAFWNIAWAVKRAIRGKSDADHYVRAACEKLDRPGMEYSDKNAEVLLSELCRFPDVDRVLISKLRGEMRVSNIQGSRDDSTERNS